LLAAAAALACHVIVSYGPAFSAVFRFLLPVGFFGFLVPFLRKLFVVVFLVWFLTGAYRHRWSLYDPGGWARIG
jgi:hypothetical protein